MTVSRLAHSAARAGAKIAKSRVATRGVGLARASGMPRLLAVLLLISSAPACSADTEAQTGSCDKTNVCCCDLDVLADPVCVNGYATCRAPYREISCKDSSRLCSYRPATRDSGVPDVRGETSSDTGADTSAPADASDGSSSEASTD